MPLIVFEQRYSQLEFQAVSTLECKEPIEEVE